MVFSVSIVKVHCLVLEGHSNRLEAERESTVAEVFVICYCSVMASAARQRPALCSLKVLSCAQGQWQVTTLKINDFVFRKSKIFLFELLHCPTVKLRGLFVIVIR